GEDGAEVRELVWVRGGGDAAGGGSGSGPAVSATLRPTACIGDVDTHRRDPVHTLHRLAHRARERAGIITAEQEREGHRTVSRHGEVLDHAGREDVAPAARVLELGQGALDPRLDWVGR